MKSGLGNLGLAGLVGEMLCPGIGIGFIIVYKNKGVCIGGNAKLFEQGLSGFRLQRGEFQTGVRVIPNRKIDHPVTVITNTIKKHNRA